jgi:hypothetical protein
MVDGVVAVFESPAGAHRAGFSILGRRSSSISRGHAAQAALGRPAMKFSIDSRVMQVLLSIFRASSRPAEINLYKVACETPRMPSVSFGE